MYESFKDKEHMCVLCRNLATEQKQASFIPAFTTVLREVTGGC